MFYEKIFSLITRLMARLGPFHLSVNYCFVLDHQLLLILRQAVEAGIGDAAKCLRHVDHQLMVEGGQGKLNIFAREKTCQV
jgi:hypothetical protein